MAFEFINIHCIRLGDLNGTVIDNNTVEAHRTIEIRNGFIF